VYAYRIRFKKIQALEMAKMGEELRKTAIKIVGDVPWGTHFCQFYETKEDLLDILVPYFKAGLEDNEFCMWVTSEPLNVEDAKGALKRKVKGLDDYIKKGQIEILDYAEWYTKGGRFDADEVLEGWVEKERQALGKGFDGLRLTGNTFWLEKRDWRDFTNYEAAVNSVIGEHRMLAVCTYCLEKCSASEIIDVVSNHEFALIKLQGTWQVIESAAHKETMAVLRESEERFRQVAENIREVFWLYDLDTNKFVYVSGAYETIMGRAVESLYKNPKDWIKAVYPEDRRRIERSFAKEREGEPFEDEYRIVRPDGSVRWINDHGFKVYDEAGKVYRIAGVAEDISERKEAEQSIHSALKESQRHSAETESLLEGARAVLENREFQDAAKSIFDICKNITGATAGYVALLSKDGTENEVLFLDSGGRSCTVDPELPMPIRGLREEAYRTGKAVYHNDFSNSEWVKFMPEGHASLDNVLFAPLIIEGEVVGLLGLANKPDGFTEDNARMATAFGELASVALHNSRTLESLENSEERFRSVVETANDAIVSIDSSGNIVFWNEEAKIIFGYVADEVIGKPVTLIMPKRFHEAHRKGMEQILTTGESKIVGRTVELAGLRKNGSEFPLELSLASWKTGEEIFFTAILRDVTDRKQAEEQVENLAKFPSENPYPVMRIAKDGIMLYANSAGDEVLKDWDCKIGGRVSEHWQQYVLRILNSGSSEELEVNCGDKVFSLTVAPVVDAGYVNIYGVDITERKQAEEDLSKYRQHLEELVEKRTVELTDANKQLLQEIEGRKRLEREILDIGEREQRRIGQELHDSIGQQFTGIAFMTKVLAQKLAEKSPQEAADAAEIASLVNQAMDQTRGLAKGLHPIDLDAESLTSVLNELAVTTEKLFAIRCTFKTNGPILIDDAVVAVHLYRIAQEAVNNAIKHGRAKNIGIDLTCDSDKSVLMVKSDGLDFPGMQVKSKGMGLQIMDHRAEMIGGSLDIRKAVEGGTIVTCEFPNKKTSW